MKCSVCAQDVPADRYANHLETEHGVTDDPTAVLIQHLTGLRATAGDEGGERASAGAEAEELDEDIDEDDDIDGLPEDEPSDADAFEQFLAAHPPPPAEPDEDEDATAEAPVVEDEDEEAATEEAPLAEEAAAHDDFEKMLATYPEVDLARKGPPTPAAGAEEDHDAKTFAVWDEARGVPDDDTVILPPSADDRRRARQRRMAALLGIAAAVILIAVAVIYLLTRDTGKSKNTAATAPVPTTATTVTPTFLPGAQGGAPTTVPDTTPTTVATTSPPTTAAPAPATTAAPAPDPAANIAFSYIDAQCINGQLQVRGSATNNNPATYSFTFAVQIVDASGNVLGRADNGSIGHLASHGSTGFVVTGSCSNVTGGHPQQQVTSITPG